MTTRAAALPKLTDSGSIAGMQLGRRSKYGVNQSNAGRIARTYGGIVYDSIAEMRYAQELDVRKACKDIRDWFRQVPFPLVVNGVPICKHFVDFKIVEKDGTLTHVEVKGAQTAEWKLKRKLLQALYPKVRYLVEKAR